MPNMTLLEIAREIGVSKQQVYRFCRANCIKEVLQVNGAKQYDDAAREKIKAHFAGVSENEKKQNRINEAEHNHIIDAVLKQSDILQAQLAAKDAQISALQTELATEREHSRQQSVELAKLADQAQQLQAIAEKRQVFELPQTADATKKKRRWFWQRREDEELK